MSSSVHPIVELVEDEDSNEQESSADEFIPAILSDNRIHQECR
jgi:hypothetical protein